jgi:hypothetical protein
LDEEDDWLENRCENFLCLHFLLQAGPDVLKPEFLKQKKDAVCCSSCLDAAAQHRITTNSQPFAGYCWTLRRSQWPLGQMH